MKVVCIKCEHFRTAGTVEENNLTFYCAQAGDIKQDPAVKNKNFNCVDFKLR